MAVRGINKVILVGRLGKIRKSVTSQTGAQWQTCRWPRQKAGATNRRGRYGSRQNGIAWCCSASSRKWLVSICARARRSTSKVSFAPVAGRITVSPVTSPKFLLRPRARAAGTQTQPEEAQQFSGQPQPESQPEPKKGGAKTKGRGRKAAQPEPQPQPPEGEDYGFSDDIPF